MLEVIIYAEGYICNQDIFKEHLIKGSQQAKVSVFSLNFNCSTGARKKKNRTEPEVVKFSCFSGELGKHK